jgi:predicted extracellular nuclease
VQQLGKQAPGPAGVSCSDVPGGLFDRPPLAVELEVRPGLRFTAISNHFASKAAPDACREAQAAFVRDHVAGLEAAGKEVLVTGDLNAFEDEGALDVLQDGTTTLKNLWSLEDPQERYSFAFQGRLQTLDHILVTDGLRRRVQRFGYEHFDNDYYDRGVAGGGHKVSDHDPPLVRLETRAGSGIW